MRYFTSFSLFFIQNTLILKEKLLDIDMFFFITCQIRPPFLKGGLDMALYLRVIRETKMVFCAKKGAWHRRTLNREYLEGLKWLFVQVAVKKLMKE